MQLFCLWLCHAKTTDSFIFHNKEKYGTDEGNAIKMKKISWGGGTKRKCRGIKKNLKAGP